MGYTKATIVTPLDSSPGFIPDDIFHPTPLELGLVDKATKLPLKELPSDKAKKLVTGKSQSYVSTKFHLYVPRPKERKHLPAIFLRISNPGSSPTLCRLNPGDYERLESFLHVHSTSLNRALDTAVSVHSQILSLDREIDKQLELPSS